MNDGNLIIMKKGFIAFGLFLFTVSFDLFFNILIDQDLLSFGGYQDAWNAKNLVEFCLLILIIIALWNIFQALTYIKALLNNKK